MITDGKPKSGLNGAGIKRLFCNFYVMLLASTDGGDSIMSNRIKSVGVLKSSKLKPIRSLKKANSILLCLSVESSQRY